LLTLLREFRTTAGGGGGGGGGGGEGVLERCCVSWMGERARGKGGRRKGRRGGVPETGAAAKATW